MNPELFAEIKAEFTASLPLILEGNDPYQPKRFAHEPWNETHTLEAVLGAVCKIWRFSPATLKGTRRYPNIARARWTFFLLAEELTDRNVAEIALFLDKDRTTVESGLLKAKKLANEDTDFAGKVSRARMRITA